jgi:hypothetical protein
VDLFILLLSRAFRRESPFSMLAIGSCEFIVLFAFRFALLNAVGLVAAPGLFLFVESIF